MCCLAVICWMACAWLLHNSTNPKKDMLVKSQMPIEHEPQHFNPIVTGKSILASAMDTDNGITQLVGHSGNQCLRLVWIEL